MKTKKIQSTKTKFSYVKIPFILFFFMIIISILAILAIWNNLFTEDFFYDQYNSTYEDLLLCKEASGNYEDDYYEYLDKYVSCQDELDIATEVNLEELDKPGCELDYVMENYRDMEYGYFNETNNYYDENCQFDVNSYINQKLNKKVFSVFEEDHIASDITADYIIEYNDSFLVAYQFSDENNDVIKNGEDEETFVEWFNFDQESNYGFEEIFRIEDQGGYLTIYNFELVSLYENNGILIFLELGLPGVGCAGKEDCQRLSNYISGLCEKGKMGIWVWDSQTESLTQAVKYLDDCE